MDLFIKISMCISIVGVILRGLLVAFASCYPRIVSYDRWEDVLYIFSGLVWAFWAWSLVYNR